MAIKPTRLTQRADPAQPNLLPREVDAHGEHRDTPLLELFGGQGHMPLGPPVGDDDEDLGHRGISAPPGILCAEGISEQGLSLCALL